MPSPTITWLFVGHPMDTLARPKHKDAMARYNALYDNSLYLAATRGKSVQLCNQLIDDALALCGSPYYRVSKHHWDAAAGQFLRLFAQES